jgi:hypothetical protein
MTGTGVTPNYVCANCGAQVCPCPDPLYAGVVTIDDRSEPGAWARHIADTACMRDQGPALPNPPVSA